MARDYAKMFSGQSPRGPDRGVRVLWMVIFVTLVGAGLVWFRLHAPHLFSGETLAMRARMNLAGKGPATGMPPPPPAAPPDEPVRFDFYNALPTMDLATTVPVTPPSPGPEVASPPPTPTPAPVAVTVRSTTKNISPVGETRSVPGQYVVQLGFFSDHTSAARTRLNLLLAGIDSLIVREKNARGETVFRIQQGPFPSVHAARQAQARLKRKGVDTLLRITAEA